MGSNKREKEKKRKRGFIRIDFMTVVKQHITCTVANMKADGSQ